MGREADMEKEFSEYVDRMLAGEEIKVISAAMDDDCRTATDFAQKLAGLRGVPSPSFKAELKEKLLSKLSQSEQETEPSSFWKEPWNMILSSLNKPIWRAVTPLVLVVILVGGVLWGTGVLPGLIGGEAPAPPPPIPAPTPAPQRPPLEVSATTGKSAYLPGEDIKIELTFKNVSSELIEVTPFPPAVQIILPKVAQVIRSFPAGTETRSLDLGEATTYTVTWNQRDDQKQTVSYGYYYLQLGDIHVGEWRMQPSFGMTAPILILPAEGAMEKTIEVNSSQTVSGITIILERVELSASGMKVYVFNTPPGYSLPQGPQFPPPPMMMHVTAEYSVDGGAVKQAGPSAIRFLENGTEHIWENLDPVPSDARELTFTITRFGDWEGPWEFRIPLEP